MGAKTLFNQGCLLLDTGDGPTNYTAEGNSRGEWRGFTEHSLYATEDGCYRLITVVTSRQRIRFFKKGDQLMRLKHQTTHNTRNHGLDQLRAEVFTDLRKPIWRMGVGHMNGQRISQQPFV
jgi:hypothetical protein